MTVNQLSHHSRTESLFLGSRSDGVVSELRRAELGNTGLHMEGCPLSLLCHHQGLAVCLTRCLYSCLVT